jgi:hypothetical protein
LNRQAKGENFYFSSFRFLIRFRLLSKRGAKVRRFFRLSQGLLKINFLGLCWAGTRSNTSMAAVKFLGSQLSVGAVAAAEPDALLVIGSAKVGVISGVARDAGQLLWGADVAGALLMRRGVWSQGLIEQQIFGEF